MKTDRREFLKGAAWMGAAAAVVGCSTTKGFGFGDGGSMATYADKPFKKLRVGIIGLGRGQAGVTGFNAIPGCEITAICDLNAVRVKSTLAAIEKGMDVALATKEVMVMAGEFVTRRAREKGVRFLPVDSEHSAIFQCLQGSPRESVERLVLTASGGPFLDGPADLSSVTVDQALHHPRWSMGPKVTVDSSTMMNKGFEILEARWLFDVPVERIDVVVHPESIVHSLVTFSDGATLAQLSPPDMRVAIQYALTWPGRIASERQKLDLAAIGSLTFRRPDEKRFPCLALAKRACAMGGSYPATLAAADEWAVARFAEGRISYLDIARTVEKCLDAAPDFGTDSIESTMEANDWTWKYLSRQAI
jgi:1-deoxy-D-xylulose-5-phosphate reductoisomerase